MYTIEHVDVPFTDEVACDINAFENGLGLEFDPGVPPLPVSSTRTFAEIHEPGELTSLSVARAADGEVVGTAWMFAQTRDNQHLCFCRMGVAADHRRRGIATKLFSDYLDFATEHDRTALLLGADFFHDGAEAFATSLGATVGLRGHVNQLALAEVPEGLAEHWIATAEAFEGAAHHYDLEWVPGPDYPEELVDDMIAVYDVLSNDAPMDDIPVGERHGSPEQLRAQTARTIGFGRERWTLIARHRESGAPAGYTEMFIPNDDPIRAYQGATAVDAAHRGYALGRWLKATMFQRLRDERPSTKLIRTFNADSNDAMLAINYAMGFKPLHAAARWVIDRADAETWLEKRT
jgi:mycothiol synthase